MTKSFSAPDNKTANNRIAVILVVVVFSMLGLSFAAVPLYDLFCRVTGLSGTPNIVIIDTPHSIIERQFQVDFDANVDKNLHWKFTSAETVKTLHAGESILVTYTVENIGSEVQTGKAIYNITPLKAGKYFSKIGCFCSIDQTLQPGEKIQLPVQFFIEPAIDDDKNMRDIKAITLSYTMNEVTN